MSHPGTPAEQVAEWVANHVVARLTAAGQTVATAESLTGGLLCAALVSVPGASVVVRGGVVAYAADVKTGVLGVPADVLDQHGTVAAESAAAMAVAARALFGADWAVATTGVAGPDPIEDKPVGTVHVAVAGRGRHPHRRPGVAGGARAGAGRRGRCRAATAARRAGRLTRPVPSCVAPRVNHVPGTVEGTRRPSRLADSRHYEGAWTA